MCVTSRSRWRRLDAEVLAHRHPEALHLADHRGVALRAQGQPDLGVAQLHEVVDGQAHRRDVVVRHERGVDPGQPAVDQHDRQAALAQPLVAGRVGGGVGVLAAEEDDPGDPAVEQHLHVVVLVHPARGLRAQHRGEALGGQRGLDDLRERREDRVDQLGHHQADEQRRLRLQPGGPVVAEHVDRGEHRLPGRVGHPRPVVEHPADRGLADVGLRRDVGQAGGPRLVHGAQSNNAGRMPSPHFAWDGTTAPRRGHGILA